MKPVTHPTIRTFLLALATSLPLLAQGGEGDRAASFAEALASWKLEAATGTASTKELRELRENLQAALVASPADAALAAVLVETEVAWIERVSLAGEGQAAEAALVSLEAAVAAAASGGEPDALSLARARAAERPAIAAVLTARAKARGAKPAASGAQSDVALQQAIATALASGDVNYVRSLGERAVAPLAGLALAIDGAPRPEKSVSPFRALMELDPVRGIDVATNLVARGDLLVKREVAEGIARGRLNDPQLWEARPGQGDVPRNPRIADVLLGLAADPAVNRHELSVLLSVLVSRAYMPDTLIDLAVDMAPSAQDAGHNKFSMPELTPYFERLLRSDEIEDRRFAVNYFRQQVDASPAYVLAGTDDMAISRAIVNLLGPRQIRVPRVGTEVWDQLRVVPEVDEAYVRATIEQAPLVGAYPNHGSLFYNLRETAAEGPAYWLPTDALLEIQTFEDEVGSIVKYAFAMEGARETEAAVALFADLLERDALDEARARDILGDATANSVEPETFWGLLEVIRSSDLDSDALRSALLTYPLYMAMNVRDTAEIWRALEHYETLAADSKYTPGPESPHIMKTIQNLSKKLEPADAARFVARASRSVDIAEDMQFEPRTWTAVLLSDDARPRNRARAFRELQHAMKRGEQVENPIAVAQAGAEMISLGLVDTNLRGMSRTSVTAMDLVEILVRDEGVSDEIVAQLSFDGRLPRELAEELVDRISPKMARDVPYAGALIGALPVAYESEVISDARLVEYVRANRTIAEAAPFWLQQAPEEDIIRILGAVLDLDGDLQKGTVTRALSTLGGLMSDDAAELLLELARNRSRTQDERDQAMRQFEEMVQWREAEARWKRSKTVEAKRQAAIEALASTLDSEEATLEQRIEAVRGLGLLGASEELPRLIALLGDEALRASAREAIDALHGPDESDR